MTIKLIRYYWQNIQDVNLISMDEINMNKVTMGFEWEPDMSFKEFITRNKSCDYEKAYDIYKKIEGRYLQEKFESRT